MTRQEVTDRAKAKHYEAIQILRFQKKRMGVSLRFMGELMGYSYPKLCNMLQDKRPRFSFFTLTKALTVLNLDVKFVHVRNKRENMREKALLDDISMESRTMDDKGIMVEAVPTARILEILEDYGVK
ncbi:hypothetical protein [Mycobacterium sp.]|uniref:hypothetical protein n=1 Tax=Mycobacterium sp. TaxID=1785 RepID=UPI003A848B67